MGIGQPLPLEIGGGPDQSDAYYRALKSAVGTGGSAARETIREAWRMARARALSASYADDRAAAQAFPQLVTDYLPVYEELLGIDPPPGATDDQRRQVVVERWTRAIDASWPKLEDALQSIDALLSLVLLDHQYTRESQQGRGFEDYDPGSPDAAGPAFNLVTGAGDGDDLTSWPNFSDEFRIYVHFNTGGPISNPQQKTVLEVRELLNESLPSWVDYTLFTTCGFILDQDLLDVTVFCDGIVTIP